MAVTNLTGYTWVGNDNMPSGYRPLVNSDIGKKFGVDLELDVIAIEKDGLQDYTMGDEIVTKVTILSTSGVGEDIYFEFGENYGDNAPPTLSPHVLIKKNNTVIYENTTKNKITQNVIVTMSNGEVITEVFEFLTNAYGTSWKGEYWVDNGFNEIFYVKDIEVIEGYEVTFVTNGGTSVTKLEDVEELPTPLPTTTKANNVFAGWYYDNLFTQKANAGDELTTNVTLYAKWHTPTTWCEDIADAIREKEGTTELIKHLDFPERILAIDIGIDVSDANAVVGDVLTGKTFYAVDDTKKTGTMVDNGTVNTDITTKAQEVTIAGGKHSGSGKVKISTTEQAKIIADNIKSGVSILGQAGGLTPAKAEETKTITSPDFSSGNIEVTPTTDKVMTKVTINKDTTNHKAENIKKDVTLYGVTGTYEGGGGVTFGGYSITIDGGELGYLEANILCEYDGSYGWHYFHFDGNDDGLVINNASLLVIKETSAASVSVGAGNLKTYDGTSISTEAALSGAKNKLCYLVGNITFKFED